MKSESEKHSINNALMLSSMILASGKAYIGSKRDGSPCQLSEDAVKLIVAALEEYGRKD